MDCIFCDIIAGKIPAYKVYENDYTYVMLDIFPNSKGHILVLPKVHGKDLRDLDTSTVLELMKVVTKLSQPLVDTMGAKGLHTMINSGCAQEIPHLHVHLIPVYEKGSSLQKKEDISKEELGAIKADLLEVFTNL